MSARAYFQSLKKRPFSLRLFAPPPPYACSVRYTVDHGKNAREGNLFWEVNRDLRDLARASQATRELLTNTWAPVMHRCIGGMTKCPTVASGTVTWRARPEALKELQNIYQRGAELIFCSFTSSTLDFKVACHSANYGKGTIFEFSLLEGFLLDNVSVYPRESEVLLPPNTRFAVTSAPVTKMVSHSGGEDGPQNKNARIPRNLTCFERQPTGGGEHHQVPAAQ